MNATLEARELNATHRCDACGAQAYDRAGLESTGGELRPLAATWQDETQHIGA